MADDVQMPLRFAPHVRAVFEQREKYVIPRIWRHENRRDHRSYAATSVQQDDFGRVRDLQEIEVFARTVFSERKIIAERGENFVCKFTTILKIFTTI